MDPYTKETLAICLECRHLKWIHSSAFGLCDECRRDEDDDEDHPLSLCTSGTGRRHQHQATGYLVDPDGRQIVSMCRSHAEKCIVEYGEKLGESWSFEEME